MAWLGMGTSHITGMTTYSRHHFQKSLLSKLLNVLPLYIRQILRLDLPARKPRTPSMLSHRAYLHLPRGYPRTRQHSSFPCRQPRPMVGRKLWTTGPPLKFDRRRARLSLRRNHNLRASRLLRSLR